MVWDTDQKKEVKAMQGKIIIRVFVVLIVLFTLANILPEEINPLTSMVAFVFAHCDTIGGPVIQSAKKALDTGNINLVLMWVKKDAEADIKESFDKALKVRKLGPEAKDMADMYFFETLVRIHRAGEGAPYTGIKTDATEVEPAIEMADKAVEIGSIDELTSKLSSHVVEGIKERFDKVIKTKKHMYESVESGRKYVEAYVIFIHYVEGIHASIMKNPLHHEESEGLKSEEHKH